MEKKNKKEIREETLKKLKDWEKDEVIKIYESIFEDYGIDIKKDIIKEKLKKIKS